ncbi:MAG: response regulator transcription factor [Chloroflexota bacterium]
MANKHRLLLIEDDFDVAEMLLIFFQSQNYEVMHADNGEDGIELARTQFPNLILLDVMLPDMDGYEICYRLRNMSLTKYIPTLFLTQKDERASKVKGLELGADDYITKPFDIDELRLRVENGIRRATRESLTEVRSGLPTGSLIEEERAKGNRKELVFRLHGFDAYTDVYSFIAASDVLYHAGQTIRDVLSEHGRNDAFVGILENDFIVLTSADDVATLEAHITSKFNDKVRTFYSFSDAAQGGVTMPDDSFVPMMSLTTGAPEPPETSEDDNSAFAW